MVYRSSTDKDGDPIEVVVEVKPIWKTKGFWIGVALIAIPVAEYLAAQEVTDWRSALLALAGVLTIIVRLVASSPVSIK